MKDREALRRYANEAYAARHEADPDTCPVCCGDKATNDRRFADTSSPASGWEESGPWYTCNVCKEDAQ